MLFLTTSREGSVAWDSDVIVILSGVAVEPVGEPSSDRTKSVKVCHEEPSS